MNTTSHPLNHLYGLTEHEAKKRLIEYGYNEPAKEPQRTVAYQFFSKFFNPLVIVLLIIAGSSLFFGQLISGSLVIIMAIASVTISFLQEYKAGKETEKLSEMVRTTSAVYRNGKLKEIPIKEIVPGDLVSFSAGDIIPADLEIIHAKDFFLNEASLTGESLPVEKKSNPESANGNPLPDFSNIGFMGSSVVSGTGFGIVLKTGLNTQFGVISKKLARISNQTSFDKGITKFTWLMIWVMVIMVIAIFSINFFIRDNLIQALLFSLAVAVGLTPEMLPMLVAVNLSKGAIEMSKKQVIVKRLNSIQNFGSMDILCTDKTGTLTLNKIALEKYCDVFGKDDKDVLHFAYINSFYQTGLKNILDKAILSYEKILIKPYQKIDEIPFDFSRRLMSVVIEINEKNRLIVKGAPEEIFKRCKSYEVGGNINSLESLTFSELKQQYDILSSQGFRVLALAYKDVESAKKVYSKEDEKDLIFKGYLAFLDPPKPTTRRTIEVLKELGVQVKVLTGDNELVTKKICTEVGLKFQEIITGDHIDKLNDQELRDLAIRTTVFARLSPIQKERVILALQANNHTVGYMGDGINDALALKAADVGISVNNAVDIAKESADIILLQKNLLVLRDGILEGRRTFGNIIKYIKMGASSNFGNMISMTGASLFLPFLPMLPIQILLNNFLYDISQVAIPSDQVDEEYLLESKPWNIDAIRKFMFIFGPISSCFDFLTFGILIFLFNASQPVFQTGWFLVSLCTQTLVIHIIRTAKIPFIQSMPSQFLLFTSIYIITIGLLIPFTPLGQYFGFTLVPSSYFIALFLIVISYLTTVYFFKNWFIKKYGYE